jgi:hypothetical protein
LTLKKLFARITFYQGAFFMIDIIEVDVQKCNEISKHVVFATENEDGSVDIFEDKNRTMLITRFPSACSKKPNKHNPICIYSFKEYVVSW